MADWSKVTLRVMVNKESNKVMYAEAGKDFVDALFSFLTLPLGTIARRVAEESNIEGVRFGIISSIYQSVTNLDEQCLWTNTCKEMLLKPRNSMEAYCRKMKLNIDDTEPMKHFVCRIFDCVRKESGSLLSLFKNQKCSCGYILNREMSLPTECLILESGFVKETASFIISDDLYVMPNVFGTYARLLPKQDITDIGAFVEQTVDIKRKEVSSLYITLFLSILSVLDILKLSLVSKTPLTDFIFKKKYWQISIKVMRRKSTGKILFAETSDDFINFIYSFLTFPLGGVLHMFQGFSSLNCFENLYKSMTELSPENYLLSQDLKNKLTKLSVVAQFGLDNPSNRGEFVKGPSTYMVTDDLVVTPMSPFNAISHLNSSNVSLSDVDEKVVTIGQKEGLSILKAWLNPTSSSAALTIGLNQFLTTIKEEK
ncbi:uncharacterized protein LOC123892038 [Trifolium pratense]|uniref:uncharacterized protein LOC123892038 n=1 Tax=Trifolium pratense TaxID=57577 RepID=UPI001E696E2F|nr:uncharacterized protein LOC123892038 [Trifolium pratense]